MANSFRRLLQILTGSVFISLLQCTPSDVAGGSSGTEVSAIAGTVLSEDGTPTPNAKVRIRPHTFLSDSSNSETYTTTHTMRDTVTDDNGVFKFTDVLPDSYTIEIILDDSLGSEVTCAIADSHATQNLPPVYIAPLAELSGSAQIYYGNTADITIQPYGFDRKASINEYGLFTLKIPPGSHTFHIAAFQTDYSGNTRQFDEIDLSLTMLPGEARDAGMLQLRPPPPLPCEDGSCDSLVAQMVLNYSGNGNVSLGDVITTNDSGRIIEFDAHDLNFTMGVPFDIVRLSELKVLDLSNTHLPAVFPGIATLIHLEIVRLSDNRLKMFSTNIGELKKLRELDLSENQLTILPESITGCSGLETLSVAGNSLCFVKPEMETWLNQFDSEWKSSQNCLYPANR